MVSPPPTRLLPMNTARRVAGVIHSLTRLVTCLRSTSRFRASKCCSSRNSSSEYFPANSNLSDSSLKLSMRRGLSRTVRTRRTMMPAAIAIVTNDAISASNPQRHGPSTGNPAATHTGVSLIAMRIRKARASTSRLNGVTRNRRSARASGAIKVRTAMTAAASVKSASVDTWRF